MTYPYKASQSDSIIPADIAVVSAAELFADGRIVVNVDAHEWTDLHGGHFGLVILLYAADGTWIWTSTPVRWGLDGKWIGTSTLTTSFTQVANPDVMSQAAGGWILIKTYNAPNDAWKDIEPWLKGAQELFGTVKSGAQAIPK